MIRPLEQLYDQRFTVAPYITLLDPERAWQALAGKGPGAFSAKVTYLFKMQQHEADAVALNKIDLVDQPRREALLPLVERNFPKAKVIPVSARTGEGFPRLVELLEEPITPGANRTEVDYDVYAAGEAELGWLNAELSLKAAAAFDGDAWLLGLLAEIARQIRQAGDEPAHVKAMLRSGEDLAVANLVDGVRPPELSRAFGKPLAEGRLLINARVAGDPERLAGIVRASVESLASRQELLVEIQDLRSLLARAPPAHLPDDLDRGALDAIRAPIARPLQSPHASQHETVERPREKRAPQGAGFVLGGDALPQVGLGRPSINRCVRNGGSRHPDVDQRAGVSSVARSPRSRPCLGTARNRDKARVARHRTVDSPRCPRMGCCRVDPVCRTFPNQRREPIACARACHEYHAGADRCDSRCHGGREHRIASGRRLAGGVNARAPRIVGLRDPPGTQGRIEQARLAQRRRDRDPLLCRMGQHVVRQPAEPDRRLRPVVRVARRASPRPRLQRRRQIVACRPGLHRTGHRVPGRREDRRQGRSRLPGTVRHPQQARTAAPASLRRGQRRRNAALGGPDVGRDLPAGDPHAQLHGRLGRGQPGLPPRAVPRPNATGNSPTP